MRSTRHRRKASRHAAHRTAPTGGQRPQGGGGNLGLSPTQAQKLIYISKKLGLPGIASMQGSSFNLYDTIILNTSTTPQMLSFFSQSNGKAPQFSNFQNGSLKAGEAMLIERLAFFLVLIKGTDLTNANNSISDIMPLGALLDANGNNFGAGAAQIQYPGSLKLATCDIIVANSKVVKTFNLFEQNPEFNPLTSGVAQALISTGDNPSSSPGVRGQNVIPMEAAPVLAPNLTLDVQMAMGPIGAVNPPDATYVYAIMCVAGRFGCIFSGKTTY